MGGNIPGGDFLGRNFQVCSFPEGSLMGWHFQGGKSRRKIFLEPVKKLSYFAACNSAVIAFNEDFDSSYLHQAPPSYDWIGIVILWMEWLRYLSPCKILTHVNVTVRNNMLVNVNVWFSCKRLELNRNKERLIRSILVDVF